MSVKVDAKFTAPNKLRCTHKESVYVILAYSPTRYRPFIITPCLVHFLYLQCLKSLKHKLNILIRQERETGYVGLKHKLTLRLPD